LSFCDVHIFILCVVVKLFTTSLHRMCYSLYCSWWRTFCASGAWYRTCAECWSDKWQQTACDCVFCWLSGNQQEQYRFISSTWCVLVCVS